jgi:DNA polymerase-4
VVSHAEIDALTIAHIDCDAFYASVEKRDAPELRDRPLIVGHPGGRGVVTTACYIARRYGVRSAMPMFQALERCAHAVVIAPDMGKYKRVSDDIRAIFHSVTDIIEPVSMDEAYLDLAPEHANTDLPPAQALATIASRVESEVRITVSIGLAPTSSSPSSRPTFTSRAAIPSSDAPRPARSWRRCLWRRSTASARSRRRSLTIAASAPLPTCRP